MTLPRIAGSDEWLAAQSPGHQRVELTKVSGGGDELGRLLVRRHAPGGGEPGGDVVERSAQRGGSQAGSRPATPRMRSSSGASSGTGTRGPNRPSTPLDRKC